MNVVDKKCGHTECTKHPSCDKVGGKAERCAEHAEEGMVNVAHKKCGRNERPLHGRSAPHMPKKVW